MKGLRSFKYISIIKLLVNNHNPRKHGSAYILNRLEGYIKSLDRSEHIHLVDAALKNHMVLNSLCPPEVKSNTYLDSIREYELPTSLILRAFSKYCKTHKNEINKFYSIRRKVECFIINGEFKEALNLLNEVEDLFGRNIWSIDMKMNIFARNPNEDLELYKSQLDKEEIAHISTLVHRKYVSNSLKLFYRQVLGNLLLEYRSNGVNRYADYLSILLLPESYDEHINIQELIIFSQRLCPIDKLLLIYKLGVKSLSLELKDEKITKEIVDFAKDIEGSIEYSGWAHIRDFYEENLNPRVCESTQKTIANYSNGEYKLAKDSSKVLLESQLLDLSILDIYVRSTIYSGDYEVSESNEIDATKLKNLLLGAFVEFYSSTDNFELFSDTFEEIFFKHLNFDFISSIKPMYYAAYQHKNEKSLKRACIELFCSEHQITPKYLNYLRTNKFNLSNQPNIDVKDISKSRRLRAEIENIILSEDINVQKLNCLLDQLEQQEDVLMAEFWFLWFKAKIKTDQFHIVLRKLSGMLILNQSVQHLFPLHELIEELEKNRDLYTDSLDAVIVYYFYFRLQHFDSKELMSEFFEDYLMSNNVNLASELCSNWKTINLRQEFFLKEVCNPEIMSILLHINSNEELLFERLKVLQTLLYLNPENEEFVSNEELRVYEQLYIDILSLEHSSNKLDIDINGIRKAKFDEYESYYSMLSDFKKEVPNDLLALFETDEKSKTENAILHFYGRTYDSILDDFIFNEDYGLVRFLSSEIRHGWLPNQIRSVIESFNLITELAEGSNYAKNTFWRKKYELTVTNILLDKFDEIFAWFSKEVDLLIHRANTWPQASREHGDQSVAFNVAWDVNTLKEFKAFTSESNSAEQFFELCTEFIWQKLENGFRKMKILINRDLKPSFNNLFDELSDKFSSLGVEMNYLNNEIQNAKNKTIEEIGIIEGWFCRPEYRNLGSVRFEDIIKVSISNTKGIYKPRELLFRLQSKCFFMEIDQINMLPLIRAFVTAFQNSIKYGERANNSDISLDFVEDQKSCTLKIKNRISKDTRQKVIDKNVIDRVNRYDKKNEKELLTTEGGTGLYKIFRFVKDAYTDASFKVELHEDEFIQLIILNKEHYEVVDS
ncbi:hypothetical protein AN214_02549 [Pseudoalteromonas sp. P1-9]|uniref:hypothetical protein n=1 Tax=Pseudoalteromonas sp. P1-9 TaxID=1710354 RepID=UPI0006D61D56|nr:hypothetical protein [Pseudoalteromonas sp. P1-9]KPV95326.1 hypothetical protein AN214_02549 [Pseudoalteromonas sp. P1-9]